MRKEFSVKVRKLVAMRSRGLCERHTWKGYYPEYPHGDPRLCWGIAVEFDHLVPDGLGGENSLANCVHLCRLCHKEKTITEDTPIMRKADRQRQRVVQNIKPKSRKIQSRGFPKKARKPKPSLPPKRLGI